ncbi:unnamed protein product, partial [Lymnaea stagnalis]
CDPGFYGADCKSKCSRNCSSAGHICDVINGSCFGCNPGVYGDKCITPCPPNCKDSVCSIKTGNCFSCKSGFYGSECFIPCSNSCKEAACEINSGNCTKCNSGFYGANCMISCPTNCKNSDCDINSGNCTSCQAGFQGDRCVEVILIIITGDINFIDCLIILACSNYTHGESCKFICSQNCKSNFTGSRVCDSANGHCLNGCRSGYDGLDCLKCKLMNYYFL